MDSDRAYYARRATQERSAAEKASSRRAREAHQQMAELYEERAQARPHAAEVA